MPEQRAATYQTRAPALASEADALLIGYADLFGQVERSLFAATVRSNQPAARFKNEYLRKHRLTARQFNAIRVSLEGKVASIRELRKGQIEDLQARIAATQKKLKALTKPKQKIDNEWEQIHYKKRRLVSLQQKLAKLQADEASGKVSLCFGSRKLFRAQFYLEANGYRNREEWLRDWKRSRSNQFFVLGSKDETAGCQGCVASRHADGTYTLRLRLPDALVTGKEKWIHLSGLTFAYGDDKIEASLAAGRALSYRFVREAKGWRIFLTTGHIGADVVTDRRLGTIGVDINPDQLAVAEIDRHGNPIRTWSIPCITYGKSKPQGKAIIGDAVKQIVEAALAAHKPLVLEKLDFSKKKQALENSSDKRSRMLSSFAYQAIIQMTLASAFRAGVEILFRNPAYTSVIGNINYSTKLGISIHAGAAVAIARRGLRLSETPSVRVGRVATRQGRPVTFPLPARNRGEHVWSYWKVVSKRMRAALAAPVALVSTETTPAVLRRAAPPPPSTVVCLRNSP